MSRKMVNLVAALVIFSGFGASAAMAAATSETENLRPVTCWNEDGSVNWFCVCWNYPNLCF